MDCTTASGLTDWEYFQERNRIWLRHLQNDLLCFFYPPVIEPSTEFTGIHTPTDELLHTRLILV